MIKNLAIRDASNRTLLLLALVLGLVTAALVGVYLKGLDKDGGGSSGGPTLGVVVATTDIPALTRVTADMVTVKQLPTEAVVEGGFTKVDQVVGQIAQVQVVAGEQVLPAKVAATGDAAQVAFGENASLSLVIPEGKRAFSIYTTKVGSVGGLARPGDYVDVVLSGAKPENAGADMLTPGSACYVLQDVLVLATGESLKGSAGEGEAGAIAAASNAGDASTATVAVSPEEAWWLAAAQQNVNGEGVGNQLWIVLRPFGEHGQDSSLPLCGIVPGS